MFREKSKKFHHRPMMCQFAVDTVDQTTLGLFFFPPVFEIGKELPQLSQCVLRVVLHRHVLYRLQTSRAGRASVLSNAMLGALARISLLRFSNVSVSTSIPEKLWD